jgi:hypothetical protein
MAVADLTNVDGFDEEGAKRIPRPMFAVEQQLQYIGKQHGLTPSHLLNRIPCAGAWNSDLGDKIVGMGFCSPSFRKRMGTSIVSVKSKNTWNGELRVPDE